MTKGVLWSSNGGARDQTCSINLAFLTEGDPRGETCSINMALLTEGGPLVANRVL